MGVGGAQEEGGQDGSFVVRGSLAQRSGFSAVFLGLLKESGVDRVLHLKWSRYMRWGTCGTLVQTLLRIARSSLFDSLKA